MNRPAYRHFVLDGPDLGLLFLTVALLAVGLVAISSASVEFSQVNYGSAWYHTERHLLYLCIAAIAAVLVYQVTPAFWLQTGWLWLLLALVGLVMVLIPGIGREVNGSHRWIGLGPFTLQPSEFAKLATLVALAGYMVRREREMREAWVGFIKPVVLLGVVAALLLLEPDFGSTVILGATAMGMLFLGGARLSAFVICSLGAMAGLVWLVVSEPYRLKRLVAYTDPWADPYGSGFQLVQSLIAFGRGEWLGVGLGNSVQKLFYLPEAHTDFVFSVWAEETGFIGALAVMLIFAALVGRIFWVAQRALRAGDAFGAYICYGVALIFSGQAFINMGVTSGLLPTKGLTLPLVSYGGSSLIVCCMMLALVLRIDLDTRLVLANARMR